MAIEITDLSALDPDTVKEIRDAQRQMLSELNERLDWRVGILNDVVLHSSAILSAARRAEMENLRQSMSLHTVVENGELADDATVDALMSNYLLTRDLGVKSAGEVMIILSIRREQTIQAGSVFQANGRNYLTTQTFSARSSQTDIVTSGDRLLTEMSDGTFGFTISVEAEDFGPEYRLDRGVVMVPVNSIPSLVRAYAADDFSDGKDEETNDQLANRILEKGLSAKVLSSVDTMKSLLIEQFPGVVASSVRGMGSPELHRDKHSIIPWGGGGRCDWYVKSAPLPKKKTITVECTLIEVDGTDGVWQFTLDRDDAPGAYEVTAVATAGSPEGSGTLTIESDSRDFNLGDGYVEWDPDFQSVIEYAYTRFQTITIKFRDDSVNHSDLATGSTRDYDVTVIYPADIDSIQDYMIGQGIRHYGGDVVVRGAVPCFLSVSGIIEKEAGSDAPDLNAVKAAMSEYVGSTGFSGQITTAALSDVAYDHLGSQANISELRILGRTRYPSGRIYTNADSMRLRSPDEPNESVTARTVVYFLSPEDIEFEVKNFS